MTSDKKKFEKTDKTYDNLSKVIQQFMAGKRYEPMGQTALLKRLKLPPTLYPLCKQILSDLIEEGIIEVQKKQLSLKSEEPEVISGILRMHHRGFGFVQPDQPLDCDQDVFIPKHLTDNAVDGDRVEILVNPHSNWEKGPEGKIVAILKRGRTHLAGTIRQKSGEKKWIAHVPLLGVSRPVKVQSDEELKVGDRVIMKVLEWGDEETETLCEMSHRIGHISDPSCDVPAATEEFDLQNIFSKAAIKEAKSFGAEVSKKELKERENLTKVKCFTIDPETAKDFDDALSLTRDKKGIYHLTVHIADVAHYVPPGSALDKEAIKRCNSTYFPGACLPMLPEELSNHLCSLRPDVIRLTASVLMDFDKEGTLIHYQIVRGYIKSAKRFSYEEAKEIIDGKKSPYAPTLKLMVELCHLLKRKRSERGSIDFSLPDLFIHLDEKGMPTHIRKIEYDISHQLVEEFMLKANEVVAKHLADQGKTPIYRIHEEPSEENQEDFFSLARSLGFSLPQKPTPKDLQQLFDKAKGTPYGQQLSVSFIRSMKLAYYSPDNVGHYGLALEHYCHFTSPIRRYSDLVTQRLLFDEEGEKADLNKIATKCSEQERISFKAETSVKILKKLRLLDLFQKQDPDREYHGTITKVKPFGLFFEVADLMLEGFLHISELDNDYFLFDPRRNILRGRSSGKTYTVGEVVKVVPEAVDFILLESKWRLVTLHKKPSREFRSRRR